MTKLQKLRPLFLRTSHCQLQRFSTSSDSNNKNEKPPDEEKKKISRPMYVPPETPETLEEPTNCCMSGCANCVWIEYAEKLSQVLKTSQTDVQKTIMDKVQDPNMRAFLSMELRVRKLIE